MNPTTNQPDHNPTNSRRAKILKSYRRTDVCALLNGFPSQTAYELGLWDPDNPPPISYHSVCKQIKRLEKALGATWAGKGDTVRDLDWLCHTLIRASIPRNHRKKITAVSMDSKIIESWGVSKTYVKQHSKKVSVTQRAPQIIRHAAVAIVQNVLVQPAYPNSKRARVLTRNQSNNHLRHHPKHFPVTYPSSPRPSPRPPNRLDESTLGATPRSIAEDGRHGCTLNHKPPRCSPGAVSKIPEPNPDTPRSLPVLVTR